MPDINEIIKNRIYNVHKAYYQKIEDKLEVILTENPELTPENSEILWYLSDTRKLNKAELKTNDGRVFLLYERQ